MADRAVTVKASTGARTRLAEPTHEPAHLTWIREARSVSKSQLAVAIGKSAALITELENGTRNATPEVLSRLADFLGCPISMLERRVRPSDVRQAA